MQSSSISAGGHRSVHNETNDFEIIPSPADFIPEEPGKDYRVDDGPAVTKGFYSNSYRTAALSILLIAFAIVSSVHKEAPDTKQSKPADYILPLMLKEHSKLKEQYNEIIHENYLIKQELIDLIRWRNEQPKQLQMAIENALDKYDADKIGLIDFALGTTGGYVTSTPNTTPHDINENHFMGGLISVKERSRPQYLLQPGVLPGQCFAFEGSEGRIRIKLMRKIMITNVTLEHVHRNLVMDDGSSAPKDFQVIGLQDEVDKNGKMLGSYIYDIEGKALQTFEVPNFDANSSYEHVELHVRSNYGRKEYTCVYRFRVHGIPKQ